MTELNPSVAVICGASKGIGLACAAAMYAQGIKVFRLSRRAANLKATRALVLRSGSTESSNLIDLAADCTSESNLDLVAEEIQSKCGYLSSLICCVGSGSGGREPFPSRDEFAQSQSINWDSSELPTRAFLPLLQRNSSAAIVYVSSIAGLEAIDSPLPYAIHKGALLVLTKKLAVSLGPEIRVNCVVPGNILTKDGFWYKQQHSHPEALAVTLKKDVPLRRLGQPEEVANVIEFLCSTKASFITGACFVVDGGQSRSFQ